MNQFENKVLLLKDWETFDDIHNAIGGEFIVLNYLWLGYSYLYYNFKTKLFSMKSKSDTDQEITPGQFKELLKQKTTI